ncbi:galactose oxidase [Dacryopinax primogenitus]|uniref:Galactose oxidase n=1 Tax=Dacryopinax primogenitus (strain DJM 731) TaxID=1858805 RepID=M5GFM4_DACPD|nr:galactose oxidase [Dacryopinax primogenitus]EJU04238.1 galactose oxidase [Dacryopinax primogenitus]
MSYKATWTRVPTPEGALPELTRSSHCIHAQDDTVSIFAGELKPREPVPSPIQYVSLSSGSLSAIPSGTEGVEPSPRVGATWTQLGDALYLFGGRGGVDMNPLEPELWKFDLSKQVWEQVKDVPDGRSYHAAASTGGDLYIHAGCPASGRLSSLDIFNPCSGAWSSLGPAPGPPRGGTVLAPSVLDNKPVLLRFGGFGGPEFGELADLAVYDVASNSWSNIPQVVGKHWPQARSVHGFLALSGEREKAILFMGEGKPAPAHLGHAGAGNFLSDVWVLTYTAEGWGWEEAIAHEKPQGRGWLAFDLLAEDPGKWKAVISGGLNEKNERMGDLWVLEVVREPGI